PPNARPTPRPRRPRHGRRLRADALLRRERKKKEEEMTTEPGAPAKRGRQRGCRPLFVRLPCSVQFPTLVSFSALAASRWPCNFGSACCSIVTSCGFFALCA